jgi:RNA polymerase sigma-70 factor, ECF subfamily
MSEATAVINQPIPDAELVARARDGSGAAFAAIMRENNRRLYRIARSILKDDAEAEDALQESYLLAFRNLNGFRGTAKLSTWLARIVVNESLGRLRRRAAAASLHAAGPLEAITGDEAATLASAFGRPSPEAAAAHTELRQLLEQAIGGLPETFRTVFVICAIEQMPVEEAATSIGIPTNTVKTRLHRAKAMLRESLGAAFACAFEEAFPFAGTRCDRLAAAILQRLRAAGLVLSARLTSEGERGP